MKTTQLKAIARGINDDIEDAEMDILSDAFETIRRDHWIRIIAIYHNLKFFDFTKILVGLG
jgi:hypothetical protein